MATQSVQCGLVLVTASCKARNVDGVGFAVSCGPALVLNNSSKPVHIQAQAQSSTGGYVNGAANVDVRLQPKTSTTLPAIPAGAQWVVIYATGRTLADVGLLVIGGAVVVTTLAGVGIFDLARAAWRKVDGRNKRASHR